ncbi:MAG: flavin reductase family protein [Candidatus Hodarchaeales archaeon]|jgi:flavin reductase (DIM6/NTAB) family NADH-FMN oxidoreductase RutF
MEKLIFAFISTGRDPDVLLMAASIRKFAGKLSDCPIWMFLPSSVEEIPEKMNEQLQVFKIDVIPFEVDPEISKFPFAGYVLAAASAEKLAKEKTDLLFWMNSDTLIFNEPNLLLLNEEKNLGYRPVHHTLVGSIYSEPIDSFWELIYRKCNVSEENFFPMRTHVDHNTIRPYFNAGCLVVRPEKGLLQNWWDNFKKIYQDPNFKVFYKKDQLYAIFIHQAVLAGIILSSLDKQELQEFPFNYNYPLHLYSESPAEFQPSNINDLVTARFEEASYLDKVPLHDPLKSWIKDQITYFTKVKISMIKKVKMGKRPIIYPIPIILAGSQINGSPNFETLGDVGIMGLEPPIVYISSGQNHYTNKGILEHGTFSINFPSTSLLTKTDYCGSVSGHDVDKSDIFSVFFGELETAPMIRECPVNLECRVIKEFSIQHRQIFIGEVVQSHVSKEFTVDNGRNLGIVDMRKLDPIIYALDNRYYKIGEIIGIGYQESKKFSR